MTLLVVFCLAYLEVLQKKEKKLELKNMLKKVDGSVIKGENGRVSVNVVKSAAAGVITITSKLIFLIGYLCYTKSSSFGCG
ncbi:hypothetical protein [Flavobacterium sp. LT1R49]|uniref:hypothetical protein n=1 Tax=Flavobacterium arabinosi TaxID=3398737 RepID=UPI003A856D73